MRNRKYNKNDLYILYVDEYVYYIPYADEILASGTDYSIDYYTVAFSKDEKKFIDVFNKKKYYIPGKFLWGNYRDVKTFIPITSYVDSEDDFLDISYINDTLEKYKDEAKDKNEEIRKEKSVCLVLQHT